MSIRVIVLINKFNYIIIIIVIKYINSRYKKNIKIIILVIYDNLKLNIEIYIMLYIYILLALYHNETFLTSENGIFYNYYRIC